MHVYVQYLSLSLSLCRKSCSVLDNVEKYCRAGKATDHNIIRPCALHAGYLMLQTQTQNTLYLLLLHCNSEVKFSRCRPGVAQRVGRGIALLFHDHGTRRGWVVSSTPRPHFTPGKNLVPIVQEAGWAPGPVWAGGKSRPRRDSIPDLAARSSGAIATELPGPPTATVVARTLLNVTLHVQCLSS